MNIQSVLDDLRMNRRFMENVAVWERVPAQPANYADFPALLDPRLIDLTRYVNAAPLYSHQAAAIDASLAGEHLALVTGTASGKSLAYNLPVLQHILTDPNATALYLFPTKALAQDQAAALSQLIDALEHEHTIPVNVYDGDTPQKQRQRIRKEGGVLISNPDMLHIGIMPYHPRWMKFFQNLKVVVLDEIHTYRGIFGSHMANVIRRLMRICRFYGSAPRFFCTSATIANPGELASRLIEAPVKVIDEDGSPHPEKHIILYNPPTIDERLGLRRSYILETRSLAGRLLARSIQTIVFAGSRLATEVLLGYIRDEIQETGHDPAHIRGYRGGYLPLERREIERGLRDGTVQGVVATNALELGVDIGALGAAVLAGYPGTIASMWQQFGRAGRRADMALGVLIASGAPLDQYIINNPAYLFETPPEHALINPDNLVILTNHLRCAAYELPFDSGERFGAFDEAETILELLAGEGELHKSAGTYRWISDHYPAGEFSLRTGTSDTVVIQDQSGPEPVVIGEVDRQSAPIMVYEGAVYMHEGRQHVISELDWENGLAIAQSTEVDYYTRASTATEVTVDEEFESALAGDCVKANGRVVVNSRATGFKIIKRYTHETLGFGEIKLPAQEFETTAYWITLTPDLTASLEDANVLSRPNDYGPNWQQQRAAARERDEYRCRHCNAPEPPDRQHHVHHIRPFREFGYVPGRNKAYIEANHIDNLLTLCPSCHRTVERIQGTRGALSGLRNVLHNLATLFLMCSPNDIGVVAEQKSKHTGGPTITVYDGAAGGLDLALRLYDMHSELLQAALQLVQDCRCADGCPACVGPVSEVGAETKELTEILLKAMISNIDTPLPPALF